MDRSIMAPVRLATPEPSDGRHRASPGILADHDPWESHKELLWQLYITEGKSLREVGDIMAREHGFAPSAGMYKKKFRQWKFRTSRRGWKTRVRWRTHTNPPPQAASAVTAASLPRAVDMPDFLKEPEASIRSIRDDIRRSLSKRLPPDYIPVSTIVPTGAERVRFESPECVIKLTRSFVGGIDLVISGGQPSTYGAMFEKCFEQIGPVIRSGDAGTILHLLECMQCLPTPIQSELDNVLLKQLHGMSSMIYGRDHAMASWTKCMLHTPDNVKADLAVQFALAACDTISDVVGQYANYSLYQRLRTACIKTRNQGFTLDEDWESLIHSCRISPETAFPLVWIGLLYYADCLLRDGDNVRAQVILQEFIPRLKASGRDDSLTRTHHHLLIGGVEMHARAAAAQGNDTDAENGYMLAVSKGMELLDDDPLLIDIQRHFAKYLVSRGRIDEVDSIYEEINNRLKDFMLGDNAKAEISKAVKALTPEPSQPVKKQPP